MTILAGDIQLLESDTMSDAPEGGGAVTGRVIVDGVSNNILDDVSTMDRVYGAANMRKMFLAVRTQTTEKYFGVHLIISKLPGDKKIGVNLFNSGDWYDRRPEAQRRVESYLAQGGIYNGTLWATQYQGSRVVMIYQNETAVPPGVGDVLILRSGTDEQYVRVTKFTSSLQTFEDARGAYQRRILTIEISDPLESDFVGAPVNRTPPVTDAAVYSSVVANAARYYSARPLSLAANNGDLKVKVDSVYSQIVPSAQSETPVIDSNASGTVAPILDASAYPVSFDIADTLSANSSVYMGSSVLPGTLSIAVSGDTLFDLGGQIKNGAGIVVGTISYSDGLVVLGSNAPSYTGTKTITFSPAAAPQRLSDTASIYVTAANRGYVWTLNINPAPQPTSLRVSFRSLNKWYELTDNGTGGLVATESSIGSGSVNYVTGSVSVTLGALPDADSEIIFSYGHKADFINRAGLSPDLFTLSKTLSNEGIEPNTLVISWNDGTAKSLSCNVAGVLTGNGSGHFNPVTREVTFSPSSIPLAGTSFAFDYDYDVDHASAPPITDTFSNVSPDAAENLILPLSAVPLAGTVRVDLPTYYGSQRDRDELTLEAEIVYMRDDALGGFAANPGSINYAAKTLTLPNEQTRGRVQKLAMYEDIPVIIPIVRYPTMVVGG